MTQFRILTIVGCTLAVVTTLQIMFLYISRYDSRAHKPNQEIAQSKRREISIQQIQTDISNPRVSEKYRQKRRLTIGIPTIKRNKVDYFRNMLSSIFNKTLDADLNEIVFVVFLADLNNNEWKQSMELDIKRSYSRHIESGSLIVIEASSSFYNGMHILTNESFRSWKIKQNYDYAFLMKYCENLSDYYMQLEDDVITRDGYYTAIKEFIQDQPNDNWVCLEFSQLGFIGKLYHSSDIGNLATLLIMFSRYQAVDVTYIYFNILMNSGCTLRKPTLFQHSGFISSFEGREQPLKDKYFDFSEKVLKGDNPPASIFTTLHVNPDFPPSLSYANVPGHFWSGAGANINDTFSVLFHERQQLKEIVVETGSKEYPRDIIYSGVLEISNQISNRNSEMCVDFIPLVSFQNGSARADSTVIVATGLLKLKCLQIRFTNSQTEWVIIKEIAVITMK